MVSFVRNFVFTGISSQTRRAFIWGIPTIGAILFTRYLYQRAFQPANSKKYQLESLNSGLKTKTCSIAKKVLRLKIPYDHVIRWHVPNSDPCNTFKAFLEMENGEKIDLHLFNHTMNTEGAPLQKVDNSHFNEYTSILIIAGNQCISNRLSDHFKSNLLRFLKEGRKNEKGYCCFDFFQDMYNHKRKKTAYFEPNEWIQSPFENESALKPGQGIGIYNDERFLHLACYLGQGVYLYLAGDSGPLIVSTLDEMNRWHNGKYLCLLTSKFS